LTISPGNIGHHVLLNEYQGRLSVSPRPRSTSPYVLTWLLVSASLRFRPTNAIEQREGSEIVVAFSDDLSTVQLRSAQMSNGPEKDGFKFDRVFPMGTQQLEVFDYGVKECVFPSCPRDAFH
jgi:hypothetical protein